MSFIKEKSSPLLPFRWEQLYELWLDIINLCLPFNFDYDMIFSESVTEMEICFEEKRIDFSRIAMSGGMPSSHSSFVTSLSTLVGMDRGFDSVEFAICVVFALIVMYDASGVRRAVGKQAAILNKIVEDLQNKKHIEHETLKELVGHTPKEVIFGAILGILVAIIMV